jgi:hypothetical protein
MPLVRGDGASPGAVSMPDGSGVLRNTGAHARVCRKPPHPDLVPGSSSGPQWPGRRGMADALPDSCGPRAQCLPSGIPGPSRPKIEVDGGINAETGRAVVEAGADVLVAGTYIYGAGKTRLPAGRYRSPASMELVSTPALSTQTVPAASRQSWRQSGSTRPEASRRVLSAVALRASSTRRHPPGFRALPPLSSNLRASRLNERHTVSCDTSPAGWPRGGGCAGVARFVAPDAGQPAAGAAKHRSKMLSRSPLRPQRSSVPVAGRGRPAR